jgi:diphthamide biosynthesis protein 2
MPSRVAPKTFGATLESFISFEKSVLITNMDAATASSSSRGAPPPLVFDDGSRIILEKAVAAARDDESAMAALTRRPDTISIVDYYEVDRLVATIHTYLSKITKNRQILNPDIRVALQFPDELLSDAPDVCWEFQERLQTADDDDSNVWQFLVFVLGDTTYAPCCPDTIAAAHLNANILVHYGHACLSHTTTTSTTGKQTQNNDPLILYSFGHSEIHVSQCVDNVLLELQKSASDSPITRKLILLYELQYAHAIEELQTSLSEKGDLLVITGEIPNIQQEDTMPLCHSSLLTTTTTSHQERDCCKSMDNIVQSHDDCCGVNKNNNSNNNDESISSCCRDRGSGVQTHSDRPNTTKEILSSSSTNGCILNQPETVELYPSDSTFYVGGLELPTEMEHESWSNDPYNILYIGDDTTRQYCNVVLRFLSKSQPECPHYFYTYQPQQGRLMTTPLTSFQRILNRRFYLIEKAKQCTVFGILVATHWTDHMRQLVKSLRNLILDGNNEDDENSGRSCYTFAVGKINPSKLANFPEIQCFVLATGCPEHSILDNERELYHVPILTPLELLMALNSTNNDEIAWGSRPYSTHPQDYWKAYQSIQSKNHERKNMCDDDSDQDVPYFSLVSGMYESSSRNAKISTCRDDPNSTISLEALPGKGVLTQYSSAAADFLSHRTYQGLQLTVTDKDNEEDGEPIQAAIPGQSGIASNYGNR